MKGKNMILLSVAVLAVGLFVLPQTMAMFVGQHTWFSVKTADAQYELCAKCHVNEVQEWKANKGAHANYSNDLGKGCFCHQINESGLADYGLTSENAANAYGFNFTNWRWNYTDNTTTSGGQPEWYNTSADGGNGTWQSGWRPGGADASPHAAVIIDCVDCHQNEMEQINNNKSAHYKFWNETRTIDSDSRNTDNNTVCLACHTHTHLNITWIRRDGIVIVADHTNASLSGAAAWNLTVELNETLNRTRIINEGTNTSTTLHYNETSGGYE